LDDQKKKKNNKRSCLKPVWVPETAFICWMDGLLNSFHWWLLVGGFVAVVVE
jgi:hypothetical protein